MHVHFEQTTSSRTDSTIQCLSWMGKVPDGLPDEGGGWKLNRSQYYMEGWLASGNAKGVVGVTFTTSHCHKYDAPPRSNFNLRGHRSETVLVRWNEPYQKLATCDSRGVIFVWIKHEGRWSIELINDRNSQVTDFAWSHDGRMALICYRDGFVLVGSVAGQRYWSSMLNLDNTSITCGVWSPDDQKVMFGTTDGQIIVMSSTGAMVSQVTVHDGMEISAMAWSCERFNMEEVEFTDDNHRTEQGNNPKNYTLAVSFKYGDVFLLSSYDDVCPKIVYTTLTGLKMDWSNCGEYLAVAGFIRLPNLQCRNELHFYSKDGKLRHWVIIPSQGKPLTALTWGHNDRRLFMAAGCHLYVAWISKQVAPLQFLCQRVIKRVVRLEKNIDKLPIPTRLRLGAQALFSPTIKSYIPDPFKLREFVSTPPPGNERMFCTMVRHGDETSGGHYTLYLEYLGGLIPLLKGKRASKLRPDFVIYDPKIKTTGRDQQDHTGGDSSSNTESDTEVGGEGCGSPRMQRKRRQKHFRAERVDRSITFRTLDELLYNDNLPESSKLVEVTSNIWGTKFQIVGCASFLSELLGHVVYKTSLLHLQPRQMTITLSEVSGSAQQLSRDPNFTPAGFSEDEDDITCNDHIDSDMLAEILTDRNLSVAQENSVANQISVDVQPMSRPTNRRSPNHVEDVGHSFNGTMNGTMNGHVSLTSDPTASFLPNRLTQSGSMRYRSLSPVRNGLNHSSLLQKDGAADGGGSNDIYANQGARPKVKSMQLTSGSSVVRASSMQPSSTTTTSGATVVIAKSDASTQVPRFVSNSLETSASTQVPRYVSNALETSDRVTTTATTTSSHVSQGSSRWADPAGQALKYIDDEAPENAEMPFENNLVGDCSPTAPASVDLQRRLYLAQQGGETASDPPAKPVSGSGTKHYSKRNSCDSVPLTPPSEHQQQEEEEEESRLDLSDIIPVVHGSVDRGMDVVSNSLCDSPFANGNGIEILQSASLPASPIHRNSSPSRRLREEVLRNMTQHLSPVFRRKCNHSRAVDSSDEDLLFALAEIKHGRTYKNLETFQKSQLKQKLKRVRGHGGRAGSQQQFVMHNKAPLWNENSQVYQLDFGGRVTQESAKNFQIEFRGKQVMQFGRIDSNAYTLDFQYPFTAIQAFAVALANVTQRLK